MDQMIKMDKVNDAKMFCMPYDYEIKKFEAESERLTKVIEREISNEFDMKIEALENRMNEKNRALHNSILESVTRALQQKPSYADALGNRSKPQVVCESAGGPGHMGPPLPPPRPGGASSHAGAVGGHLSQHLGVSRDSRVRGRSPSIKRMRSEDGTAVEVESEKAGEIRNRSSSRPSQKKCVVGTSNNSIVTTRKMRSPPADIFVWGIHPDTTIQDIVADLADSGIIIQDKDVIKKSKPEANLISYKISVKAEDLQRALDPSVWPLRVKVREFIHYARKYPRQTRGYEGQAVSGSPGEQGHQGRKDQVQAHHVQGPVQQGELPLAPNRYALLGEDASGTSWV